MILLAADLLKLLRGDAAPDRLLEAIERGAVISMVSLYEVARGLPHIKTAKLKTTLEGYGVRVVNFDLELVLGTERFFRFEMDMELAVAFALATRERLELLTGSPQDIPDALRSERTLTL